LRNCIWHVESCNSKKDCEDNEKTEVRTHG
jgi:hypothetical protein